MMELSFDSNLYLRSSAEQILHLLVLVPVVSMMLVTFFHQSLISTKILLWSKVTLDIQQLK